MSDIDVRRDAGACIAPRTADRADRARL